jgi:hypothetical protein
VDTLPLLAEPLEERRRVADLGLRLGERLALLERQQEGEVVQVLQHQIGPAAQDPRTIGGPVPPAGESARSAASSAPRVSAAPMRGTRASSSPGRVGDREGLARVGVDPPAVEPRLLAEELLALKRHLT